MIKTTEINNRTNIIAFKKVCTWPLMLAISSILASPVYAAPPSAVGPQYARCNFSFPIDGIIRANGIRSHG